MTGRPLDVLEFGGDFKAQLKISLGWLNSCDMTRGKPRGLGSGMVGNPGTAGFVDGSQLSNSLGTLKETLAILVDEHVI